MTVYITGDLHGSKLEVEHRIEQIENPKEEDIIIVCGDAGLEYGNQIQGAAKKAMKKFPGSWVILRGNHDTRYWRDHTNKTKDGIEPESKWHFEEKYSNFVLVQDKYPNIHYTEDVGGVYTFENYNCLLIPGAYSVDKAYRLSRLLPYEYEEQLSYMEWTNLSRVASKYCKDIDFVIGHTFPLSVENELKYLFLSCVDQKDVEKTTERWISHIMVYGIYESPRFKRYFGGHYHDDKMLDLEHILVYRKVLKMEDYA